MKELDNDYLWYTEAQKGENPTEEETEYIRNFVAEEYIGDIDHKKRYDGDNGIVFKAPTREVIISTLQESIFVVWLLINFLIIWVVAGFNPPTGIFLGSIYILSRTSENPMPFKAGDEWRPERSRGFPAKPASSFGILRPSGRRGSFKQPF